MTVIFGYDMENGITHIDEPQATIIRETIKSYIGGDSLKTIAERLTDRKIEYAPGKCLWNKNRIQRMLTDKRYLGDSQYPTIIDSQTHQEIQKIMSGRNTQTGYNRETNFSPSVVPLLCGKCGSEIRRRFDKRWKIPLRHICTNPECGAVYCMTDEKLWGDAKKLLSTVKTNEPANNGEILHNIHQLENEIAREFQYDEIDGESLQAKMYRLADLKYQLNRKAAPTNTDISKLTPCTPEFIRELKKRVKAVMLVDNENIRLIYNEAGKE